MPATQDSSLLGRDILSQLAALSKDRRAVLLLVGIEGLTYSDAVEVLGLPVGTVMSRLAGREDNSAGRSRVNDYSCVG